MLKIKIIAILITLFAIPGYAQPKENMPIPFDPHARYGKLSNGFTYYLRNLKSQKPQTVVRLLVKVGFMDETADQQGLAHLIEHLIGNAGTTHFPQTLEKFRDENGLLAYMPSLSTDAISTQYTMPVPSDNLKLLEECLRMFREMAHDTTVLNYLQTPERVDNERRTVLQEFMEHERISIEKKYHLLNEPKGHLRHDPAIIEDRHNENIKSFRLESVTRFYRDWYRPERQALIIVGDIDVDAVEEQVKALFSDFKNPDNPPVSTLQDYLNAHTIKLKGKNQRIVLTDKNQKDIELEIHMKRPATRINGKEILNQEQYRESLLENLYNVMARARFATLASRYLPPFSVATHSQTSLFASYNSQIITLETFVRGIEDPKSVRQAFYIVMTELERIRKHGFSESELAKAKTALMEQQQKVMQNELALVAKYESHYKFGSMAPSPEYECELMGRLLKDITAKHVHTKVEAWLGSNHNRDVVFTVPEIWRSAMPTEIAIEKWIREIRSINIKPWGVKKDGSSLMTEKMLQSLSKKIEYKQSDLPEIGGIQIDLANGIKIILKPMESKNSKVEMIGFAKGGASVYKTSDYFNVVKANEIIVHSGAGGFDKFQLAQRIQNKDVHAYPFINDNTEGINANASSGEFEQMMQLVYLYLVFPNKNELAFEDWYRNEKKTILSHKASSSRQYYNRVAMAMNGFKNYTMHDLEQTKLQRAFEIYRQRFKNMNGFTFVLTGSFESEKIKPIILKYFGNLPSNSRRDVLPLRPELLTEFVPKSGQHETIPVLEGPDYPPLNIFYAGLYQFDEKENLELEILQRILRYTLTQRLKSKEGTYFPPGTSVTYGNSFYRLTISTASDNNPETVKRLKAAISEEIESIRQVGPNAKQFEGAIYEIKDRLTSDLNTSAFWVQYLYEQSRYKRDMAAVLKRNELLNTLTRDDVQSAAKKYLSNDNLSTFVMILNK